MKRRGTLLALGLIVVVAMLVFGRDPVVTVAETLGLIFAVFVLPVVLGGAGGLVIADSRA